jgi:DNA-binding CsgD family transcriptional regulator
VNISENRFKQLSAGDTELVVKLSERIHYTSPNEPFLNHVFVVLSEALPRAMFAVDSYSVNPVSLEQASNVGISNELYAVYRTYMHQHPLMQHFMASGGSGVGTILTLTSAAEFHKTDLYRKFYKILGIEDQLVLGLRHPTGAYLIVYSRDTAFTGNEVLLMELLMPQLRIALRSWQRSCDLERFRRTLHEKSDETGRDRDARRLVDSLSPRQLAIAEQVARGLENRQIAQVLHISPKTVGKHLENIFEVLDIHHRAALAAIWQRSGR